MSVSSLSRGLLSEGNLGMVSYRNIIANSGLGAFGYYNMEYSPKIKWASIVPLSYELKDNVLEVSYPGFFSDDFSRKKIFLPQKIAKVLESSRAMNRLLPALQKLNREDKTLMVLTIDYDIRPEFYALTAFKRSFPYKIANWVSSVGRSSFVMTQVLFKEGDRKPLITCKGTYVYVDWKTRRSHPLPPEVKNSVPLQETNGSKMKLPEIPDEKYCFEAEVQPSDIDSNLHTNQGVYLRLCLDAAASAEASSFYKGIRDVPNRPLSQMWTFYVGESLEGDKLTICTWQSLEKVDVIYFVIEKECSPIFYCRWKLEEMPLKASL